MDCLFCSIIKGEIPSNKIYENKHVYAFYDVDPKAPVHFLVIPKQHIVSAAELTPSNSMVVSYVYEAIAVIAKELKLEKGFRVVTNVGEDGGQTVAHLHFHVLGMRSLAWPPG